MDKLAQDVNALPDVSGYRNTWGVKHDSASCQLMYHLYVSQGPGSELRETGLYGFSETKVRLERRERGYRELPGEMRELIGLVRKALGDWKRERDMEVIERVKSKIGVRR